MKVVARYRGRELRETDLGVIRDVIAAHPEASRRQLSKLLCQAWDWRQENGQLRDMLCRSLLLVLHRAGHISLPPVRQVPPNNAVLRRRPSPVPVDRTPLVAPLSELGPLEFRQVRRTAEERLCEALIAEHHYLGYVRPVGEHLKYLVWARDRVVACFAWSSPPRHLAPRDRFIGWSAEARRRNLRFLAYNTRYLILPWVHVPHLGSHLLGRVARLLSSHWEQRYGHPIYYLESFVDPARFRGTCYRAANWRFLGPTTGRGHNARTNRATQPRKEVLGLPLTRRFRALLSVVS